MKGSTRGRVARAFWRHKLGLVGMIVLIILYTVMIFAEFLSPYSFKESRRDFTYAAPSRIRCFHRGRLRRPFVYPVEKRRNPVTFQVEYVENPDRLFPIKLLARGDRYRFWGLFETDRHLFGIESQDTVLYLLGGDRFGRDLFSRLLMGSRVSLTAGIIGTLIAVVIGALIGSLSGYYGGWIDVLIQRFIEILRSFPRIPLWLALAMLLPPTWPSTLVYLGIVIVLSFIGWMGVARVMRGMTLSLREKEFVLAARVIGQSDFKIITRHLIPNSLSYLVVVATLSIPAMILGESAISFLGLGIKEPMTSWGLLLKQAQSLTEIQAHPWLMIPGIFIMVAVLSFNFLGDALRDALDPYRTVEKV